MMRSELLGMRTCRRRSSLTIGDTIRRNQQASLRILSSRVLLLDRRSDRGAMNIIGHGIDIVAIRRLSDLIDRCAEDFLEATFTLNERAEVESPGTTTVFFAGRFGHDQIVDPPFWWIPVCDRRRMCSKLLLNARSPRNPVDLWMPHAGVFAHLTEQILAVDKL